MATRPDTSSQRSGAPLRWGIVGAGVLVLTLLFFADKTNLEPTKPTQLNAGEVVSGPSQTTGLPALAPDPQLDGWISQLSDAKDEEKSRLLDSIVVALQARNRFAYAADYAFEAAELDRSFEKRLRAGVLSQQATELSYVASDTAMASKYGSRAVELLGPLVESDPNNEEALLHYGLALVVTGKQPMNGILTIRKVLELNPDNVEAGYRLGTFSIQTGQYDKAAQRFLHVLEVAPDHYPAMYQLAVVKSRQGDVPGSLQLLEQVVAGSKDSELTLSAREMINSIQ
ncbi:tetratricopeptide repeat protein [Pontibacter sp. G13]|uniref:tetratricopeptide repeat protein n=1 Tax=Pontibacter sp. G13 TaxID=3074898 RepID=UPI00288B855C|nr:tetratricopeptide repeat protein [Pontibacter sp. G13]WNJ20816.1 hypothetical protein RJD25_10060 [Pontibacter sp. G13]